MKKILLIAVAVLGISTVKGQESKTSLIAGYTNATLKAKVEAFDESDSDDQKANGFFVGLTHQFDFNDQLSIVPGIIYTNITAEDADESDNYIQIPLFLKYQAAEKIALLAGPKFEYVTNTEDELDDYINDLSLSFGLGIEISLSEKFAFIGNYSFQLSNTFTEEFEKDLADENGVNASDIEISARHQFLNLGLAYKF